MNSYLRTISASFALYILIGVSACDQQNQQGPSNEDSAAARPHVALVMKSLANEFFTAMAEGAQAHQAKNAEAYQLTVNGIKNEVDLAQQVALVEQMIASRVDAIVIAPASSQGLIPVIRKAQAQGITVVNIDNKLDTETLQQEGMIVPFIGPDNREGAYEVAKFAAQSLDKGDQVAILGGAPGAFNAQQRALGFKDAIAESGLSLVSEQSADWEQGKAASVTSAIISEQPKLKAIFAANDNMALGALAALRQANKVGEVVVIGFDNIQAAKELVEKGDMLATADQHGDKLAVYGIEYALSILNGEPVADKKTPVDLVVQ